MKLLCSLILTVLATFTGSALADPATHSFTISAAQSFPSDCGQGGCSTACKLTGVVTNVSRRRLQAVSLEFSHPHPGLDRGILATTAFSIPALDPGAKETIVEWVNGLKCVDIDVRSVKAKCLEGYCSYISIRIPNTAVPKLKAMKVDVD
jgi:hypothetical protein